MGLGRWQAHMQRVGELGVGKAAGDEPENVPLTVGELVELGSSFRWQRRPIREVGDQPAGNAGREQRVARGDHPDRGQQLGKGAALQRESARSGSHRLEDILIKVEGGEDEDARA